MGVEGAPRVSDQQATVESALVAPKVWRSITSSALFDVTAIATELVLMPILLAHLGKEQFGLTLTIGGLVGYLGLADLGLGQTVTRNVAAHVARGERDAVQRIVDTALGLYVFIALAIALVGLGLAPVVDRIFRIPPELVTSAKIYAAIVAIRFAISLPTSLLGGICVGHGRWDLYNLGRLLSTVASFVLTLIAIRGRAQIVGITLLTTLSIVGSVLVHGAAIRRLAPWLRVRVRRVSWEHARPLLSFSIFFWVNQLVVLLVFQSDNMVIGAALGVGMVTAYGLTQHLLTAAMQITFKLSDTLYPTYAALKARGEHETLRRQYYAATQYSVTISLVVAGILLAYGAWIMRLWTGPEGFAGTFVLGCFASILVIHTPVHVAAGLVAACGRLHTLTVVGVLEGVLNLVLSLWWVRRYGIGGVALATFVSMAVTTAWYVPWYALREAGVALRGYLARAIVPGVVAAVPTLVVLFALHRFSAPRSVTHALVEAAIAVLVATLSIVLQRRRVRALADAGAAEADERSRP
jgi:O-antigen/teichoic acid export membrane protein